MSSIITRFKEAEEHIVCAIEAEESCIGNQKDAPLSWDRLQDDCPERVTNLYIAWGYIIEALEQIENQFHRKPTPLSIREVNL